MNELAQAHPLPPHVRQLGVLMKSLADRIAEALSTQGPRSTRKRPAIRLEQIADVLESRLDFVRELQALLEQINERVLTPAKVDDAVVRDVFESLRNELGLELSQLDDLERAEPGDVDPHVCRWLVELHQQLLQDVQIGLADFARALEDPVAELGRRQGATTGDVTLALSFRLRPLRHQRALRDWLRQQVRVRVDEASNAEDVRSETNGIGLLDLVLLWTFLRH